ncbi:MAG: SynChlorMet cassette radical SAM/SPASM protein ScmE [Desulfobacterales bacterium]|nr:MAG: SynChlorMet cassette radical SAM/SPASM protein ScmE [Desulfobacterales bacterium]
MKIMRTPRSVDLDITNSCNLRCRYCYYFSGPGDVDKDLPTEEWLRFFQELNHLAVMNVTLAGGEPFFKKDLRELIEGIVENRMRFSILSNGTLITDEMAAFIFSTKRCDSVQVSIDGSKPETHDVCRGKGSFDRAIKGIRCLQKYRVPVNVRVTIHKHNVSDLEAIARLLLDEMGLPDFSTNAASYMGLCRQNVDQIGLTVEDRMHAMETLLHLNKTYDHRISAEAGPLAEATMWSEMELARRNGKKHIPLGGSLTACGCVMDKIAVRADGTIVPCTMLSHIELGRINQDDFKQIWQSHPEMTNMRERCHILLSSFAYCQGCEFSNYCTGNCPGLAYTITGKVNHPSPDACLKQFFKDGGKLPELQIN